MFNQKANLDRHLLLHTNISEKSYPCEQCSASYLSMASLREHIKVAHIGVSYYGFLSYSGNNHQRPSVTGFRSGQVESENNGI